MIHLKLIDELKQKGSEHFVYPDYGRYSIAEIVPSLLKRFGVESRRGVFPDNFLPPKKSPDEKVLLFMADGLGFDHFVEHQELDFFHRLATRGQVHPITSVFPSTTPAALTTIHTGLTPQEHGLPEWTVYFEEVDRIIQTLPFTYEPGHRRESVMDIGGAPEMLYEGDTIYERLRVSGIKSFMMTYYEYVDGSYTRMTQKGAETIGYLNGTDLFAKLKEKIENTPGPAYFFVYWSEIDRVEHFFGPRSPEHIKQLEDFSFLVNRFLSQLDQNKSGEVLVLLTADHGQTDIRGENIIYLNQYLPVQENYSKSKQGNVILPSGAPHDVFLAVNPEKLDETRDFLAHELKERARVLTINDALKEGLFGLNDPSVKFLRRVGNLLILPFEGTHVWYKYGQEEEYRLRGMHGGLSEKEMVVPFASAWISDLLGRK